MKSNKYNKLKIIIVSLLLLAVTVIVIYQGNPRQLTPRLLREYREKYPLYTNVDEGWRRSDFRDGTEIISEETFRSITNGIKSTDDFAVIIGRVLEEPYEQVGSLSSVHVILNARTVAGNRNVNGNITLNCSPENFYGYQNILVEGNKYLFIVSSGNMISRNTTWYVAERRGVDYVLSVLKNKGMQQWDGYRIDDFLEAIGVE